MIKPLQDNLIIEPLVQPNPIPDGIVLPERARDDAQFGIVREVGPSVQALKPGDTVILPSWYDDKIEIDGKTYVVLAEKSISVRVS